MRHLRVTKRTTKTWAGGLKSQGAAGCNFVASPDHALTGRGRVECADFASRSC